MHSFKLLCAGVVFASALVFVSTLSPLQLEAADAPTPQELLDRAAIQNLVVKYTIALDTLDAEMYAGVFAADAEFTFGGNTYRGRDAIRKIVTDFAAQRAKQSDPPKSYHALTNTYVEFVSDREAHHRSYWQTITGPSSGPFTVGGMGRYDDTLVKRNGEWLIQKRQIVQ